MAAEAPGASGGEAGESASARACRCGHSPLPGKRFRKQGPKAREKKEKPMRKLVLLMMTVWLALGAVLSALAGEEMASIVLSDAGIQASPGVEVTGTRVRITQPGSYLVSGSLAEGQLEVDCPQQGGVTLYLSGVDIRNATGPALLVGECSPRLTISLVDGTENFLSDGTQLVFTEDDEPNGVIFSRSDLTIEGGGALTVDAGAMDGIVSKDDLKIKGGLITVTAPRHGVRGKDAVEISGGTLVITAGRDGIKATNKTDPQRGYVEITGGDLTLRCGDEPVDWVTRCTVREAVLQLEPLP